MLSLVSRDGDAEGDAEGRSN